MSGGIDSSAVAAMLVNEGYEVVGLTLKVWQEEEGPDRRWQERSCCKVGLARYVSKKLGIQHHLIDAQAIFREAVVEDFISSYKMGQTPNPCVRCNEKIKFGLLYDAACNLGADYLATGHYARLERNAEGGVQLKQGLDAEKDQSYFLYRIDASILPHLIFPLGHSQKKDVWQWVERLDLPPDEIQESQEICFVTQGDYREFLRREAPEVSNPGPFLNGKGEVLGEHEGVAYYTVGQRRGLGISSSAIGERLYVVNINAERNEITLGSDQDLFFESLTVNDLNYLQELSPVGSIDIEARVRYRGPKISAILETRNDGGTSVLFKEPQKCVTPGQSVVFYQGDVVVGGGIISATKRINSLKV